MKLPGNRIPFFEKLFHCKKEQDLIDLVIYLHDNLALADYEFSFATKLLHTVNPDSPIYDSKVYKYLKKEERVDFWNIQAIRRDARGREIDKIEKIAHNWDRLTLWYSYFLASKRGEKWIKWFDKNFPSYAHISNVKKIDFIIFSCSGY